MYVCMNRSNSAASYKVWESWEMKYWPFFSSFDIFFSVVLGQQLNKFSFWKKTGEGRQINQGKFFPFPSHKAVTCLSSLICEFCQKRRELSTQPTWFLTTWFRILFSDSFIGLKHCSLIGWLHCNGFRREKLMGSALLLRLIFVEETELPKFYYHQSKKW